MSHLVDRMGVALLDASLAALAITGLVVLAMVQCRQPARRLGWARAGLLSTLVLLPLSAFNPVPRIDIREPLQSLWHSSLDEWSPGHPRSREGPHTSPLERELGGEKPACERPDGETGRTGKSLWTRRLARGLVLAYAAGLSIGLGSICLGLWGSAWLVRQAWEPSARSLEDYDALPLRRGSPRPRLLVCGRVHRAVLVGILRPVILIPPELDEWEAVDRRRLSLLHELAHAEGGDHRFSPAASLASASWFFLPPAWWILGQMKLDQEFVADRRAVAHFGTTGGYASSLVELAAALPSVFQADLPPTIRKSREVSAAIPSALFQRILMLVKCPFAIEGQTPLWWRWFNRADARLDDSGGLMPDPPGAFRMVEFRLIGPSFDRRRAVDPRSPAGHHPTRERRSRFRPPAPAARPVLTDVRGAGQPGRPLEARSPRPPAGLRYPPLSLCSRRHPLASRPDPPPGFPGDRHG